MRTIACIMYDIGACVWLLLLPLLRILVPICIIYFYIASIHLTIDYLFSLHQ